MDLNLIRNISHDTQVFWIEHKIGFLFSYHRTKVIHILNRIYADLCQFSKTFFDLSDVYKKDFVPMISKKGHTRKKIQIL